MILNENYLIQKYAEAREKQATYVDNTRYWSGIMDAYHSLLAQFYPGWAELGTPGYRVFYEGMDWDKALFYNRTGLPIEVDPADMADAVEEDSYWKAKQSWSDSRVQTDDDE